MSAFSTLLTNSSFTNNVLVVYQSNASRLKPSHKKIWDIFLFGSPLLPWWTTSSSSH